MQAARRTSEGRGKPSHSARTGSVLLVVLVVVALLALGAYTFSEFMIVEAEATSAYGREVQARAAADSGVELAASLLSKRFDEHPQSYFNNPEWFGGILVKDSTGAKGRSRFMVVSAAESDTSNRTLRYGLFDESSKLNLNTLVAWVAANTITAQQAETILTGLSPDLTVEIADAIIDWIDTDQNPMQNGAELDYYQGLNPPYATKDNKLDTLDELLLVRGVTPALLFGEDINHNGVLDPNENDGSASLPLDNADGILQRGWSQFLTVYSREGNLKPDGEPKTNVNMSDLSALFTAVSADFGEDVATFILAYRLFGPSGGSGGGQGGSGSGGNNSGGSGGNSGSGSGSNKSGGGMSSGGGGGRSGGGGSSGGRSGGGASGGMSSGGMSGSGKSSGSGSTSSGGGSQKSSSGGAKSSGAGSNPPPQIVAGMDISKGGNTQVKSLYELFGASTSAVVNGATQKLSCPWTNKTADVQANAVKVMERLTLTDDPYVDGRINVNLAPREVLLNIPNMTPELADSIVGAQDKSSGTSSSSQSNDRLTSAWLVIQSLTDLSTLQSLDPYITARGDVFHLQSVGYFDGGGPMARVEAVIDATQIPPQVVFMRDLTELGRGFPNNLLPVPQPAK
jgi:type II secretory pathway component PulK